MTNVERVCLLLESILLADGPVSFRELAEATGIHRRTLARFLNELEDFGFIERGPRGSRRGGRLETILACNSSSEIKVEVDSIVQV